MLKRTCGVCSMSPKKTLRHARIILLLILLFIYMDYTLHGIRSFCLSFGVKVSIFEIIVQMFSSANVQGCFILFYAFLISDLPGVDLCEQYVLVRSGKWSWILGKMMTVICLAFVWLLIIALYTFIIVRELNFSTKWGSAMITLSKTNAYSEYSIRMIFESKVITNYTLPQATILSIALNASYLIVGSVWVLLINFVSNRPAGCFVLAATAFISMSIGGILNSGAIYKFSPASLALLSVVNGGIDTAYPTLQYAIIFYISAAVLGCTLLLIVCGARKDFSKLRVS